MNTNYQNITPQFYKVGSVTAYYNFGDISNEEVKCITELVYHEASGAALVNQSLSNISVIKIPEYNFHLSKKNGKYQLDFYDIFSHLQDYELQLVRDIYKRLSKDKYPSTICFYNKNSKKLVYEYSDRSFWLSLLQNNAVLNSWIIIFLVPALYLADLTTSFLLDHISQTDVVMNIRQYIVDPLLGYPASIIGTKLWHTIWKTRLMTTIVVLLTVFLYNYITGNTLVGSLILLGVFILEQIRERLLE